MTTAEFGGPPLAHLRDTDAASLVAALRSRAEDIRRAELARAEGCWEVLCSDDRRRLETLTLSLVGALLDEPTALLQATTDEHATYLESARYLFGLEARPSPGSRSDRSHSPPVGQAERELGPRPGRGLAGVPAGRTRAPRPASGRRAARAARSGPCGRWPRSSA